MATRAVAERCGFHLEGVHRNVMQAPDGTLRHSCVYAKLPNFVVQPVGANGMATLALRGAVWLIIGLAGKASKPSSPG